MKLKEVTTKKEYTLLSDSHASSFVWKGTDGSNAPLPDGFYYWTLEADAPTITFIVEEGKEPVPKTAPAYNGQSQMVLLDRTAPEVLGVHPLGNNRLAIETRDMVGGLKKVTTIGSAQGSESWTTSPIRTAVAVPAG
ncbi:hypothetical protein SD71_01795 [Cohnella kolymensis]|uniref:Uncharacterized protein n=1 Tax=Cohnella kolymensis TaxID=1590652 RepID=A0ABR5A8W3_9BACL|nr:hypothetical protein [Cohnella kolymensis]KIL37416.1 hypothetical protein SD71_01795 [Cohnella kolymensis]